MNNRFYSKSTGCTYLEYIHGDQIPVDAVPITESRYLEVIANPELGKIRSHDSEGLPVLIDPPSPTYEQQQYRINTEARAYLSLTDWYVIRLQEIGEPVPEDILLLRAEARSKVIHLEV